MPRGMSPRSRLAMRRAQLSILLAPLAPGETRAADHDERVAALRDEIALLEEETGGLFALPERRDIDS